MDFDEAFRPEEGTEKGCDTGLNGEDTLADRSLDHIMVNNLKPKHKDKAIRGV